MALALFAVECGQAKQKEVKDQPCLPSPTVVLPPPVVESNFVSPTLKQAVESQFGQLQLESDFILDPSLAGDKPTVLQKVKKVGLLLQFASPELKKDKEVVMAAVKQDGMALQFADFTLRGDDEIALAAVRQNWNAISLVHSLNIRNEDLIASTREFGHVIPRRTREYLKQLNIEQLCRNTWYGDGDCSKQYVEDDEVIKEIIINRIMLRRDARPVAVAVFPKADWNGAFRSDSSWGNAHRYIEQMIKAGYRVLYYEANTENDLYAAIRESGGPEKISLLVIGGHGYPGGISFGGYVREIDGLGFNDMDQMRELADLFSEECVVILDSCSTGAGQNNIARQLGHALPKCGIFAPKMDCEGFGFRFNENQRVIGAAHCCKVTLPEGGWEFSCDERYTTIVNR
ncbi:MAG: DUF4116 domain-containing protein [Candidatus Margulisiibacteriota bacterium]